MPKVLDAATDLTFVPLPAPPGGQDGADPPSRWWEDAAGVTLQTGRQWRSGDAGVLLSGLDRARVRSQTGQSVQVTLVHAGAGGISLLRAAAAEHPGLRISELRRHRDARNPLRWRRFALAPPDIPAVPAAGVAITGGLGGIGLAVARRLAAAGHPLWLVDRRGVMDVDVCSRNLLAELACRTPLVVTRADVTGRVPVPPFPVAHVIHAAGTLRLCPVRDLTEDTLERWVGFKAASLTSWVRALSAGLSSVIAFGSVESHRPHRSFGAYALGNELLRRQADRLREEYPRLTVITAEWSLWGSVGMAAPAAALAGRAGFAVVPPGWGAAATQALLLGAGPVPGTVVLGGPQSSPDDVVRAVPGVGGSTHSAQDRHVRRLVELCRPVPSPRSGRPAVVAAPTGSTGGRVVRAMATGDGVETWLSSTRCWDRVTGGPR